VEQRPFPRNLVFFIGQDKPQPAHLPFESNLEETNTETINLAVGL
jgi:hypothetical protein